MKRLPFFVYGLILFTLLGLSTRSAFAQITLTDLPTWTSNTRFGTAAVSQVKHPSLSLNGFDCGNDCDLGYGLKQILEEAPTADQGTALRVVFDEIVDQSSLGIDYVPSSWNDIVTILYETNGVSDLAMAIYDVIGRRVWHEEIPSHYPGEQTIRLDLKDLPSGVYFAKILDGRQRLESYRLVVM